MKLVNLNSFCSSPKSSTYIQILRSSIHWESQAYILGYFELYPQEQWHELLEYKKRRETEIQNKIIL